MATSLNHDGLRMDENAVHAKANVGKAGNVQGSRRCVSWRSDDNPERLCSTMSNELTQTPRLRRALGDIGNLVGPFNGGRPSGKENVDKKAVDATMVCIALTTACAPGHSTRSHNANASLHLAPQVEGRVTRNRAQKEKIELLSVRFWVGLGVLVCTGNLDTCITRGGRWGYGVLAPSCTQSSPGHGRGSKAQGQELDAVPGRPLRAGQCRAINECVPTLATARH